MRRRRALASGQAQKAGRSGTRRSFNEKVVAESSASDSAGTTDRIYILICIKCTLMRLICICFCCDARVVCNLPAVDNSSCLLTRIWMEVSTSWLALIKEASVCLSFFIISTYDTHDGLPPGHYQCDIFTHAICSCVCVCVLMQTSLSSALEWWYWTSVWPGNHSADTVMILWHCVAFDFMDASVP